MAIYIKINSFNEFLMLDLLGNDTLFVILAEIVSVVGKVLGFKMALAAILNFKVWWS